MNPYLCITGEVLYQLSYQTNWELFVMWVDDKPMDDGYRSTIYMILIDKMHEFETDTKKRVEKTRLSLAFSTHFSVFGYLMKHPSLCLIYDFKYMYFMN